MILTAWQEKKVYTFRGTVENIYLSACNIAVDMMSRGFALTLLNFMFACRFLSLKTGIIYWILLMIGMDFMFYWMHRVDHRCRLFGAIHVTHHSSDEFNFTVGFRSSVFQPLYRFIYFIPLAFMGFQSGDIYLMYSASQNMGMILIVWDRMFGTFQSETVQVEYGITKPLQARNALNLMFHEWLDMFRDARQAGMRRGWAYIFGAPEIAGKSKFQAPENVKDENDDH
jgi:sterol desaturase/sphingolipid hydroxylase (fatty acid hydroxylase superfamily)